jgi:hypothetical protein
MIARLSPLRPLHGQEPTASAFGADFARWCAAHAAFFRGEIFRFPSSSCPDVSGWFTPSRTTPICKLTPPASFALAIL